MSKNISRRNFIKEGAGAGLFFSLTNRFSQKENTAAVQRPVVITSGKKFGLEANEAVWEVLMQGGSALDAVEKGANTAEANPENIGVGYGGIPNEDGIVELDASVMCGKTGNAGAVGGLRNIKHPSSVARLVMERTDHVMLAGGGALEFAKAHGFKEENLLTEKTRKIWLKWKENLSPKDDWFPPPGSKEKIEKPQGTINILAVDKYGDIAGITTTSGLGFKISGRLGDSPIIGAGLYVDNNVGAAGATGRGEEVIKVCGSYQIVENMRNGMTPQQACEDVCKRIIEWHKGKISFNDKFVAVNKAGLTGCASLIKKKNTKELTYTVYDERGNKEYFGKFIIK
ncbi:N(4)-(beta-N-acetylglucosaminyl)-L-asparaginase [bacterium]|nr:N(4)-(beta-N-acetylglucosaminyl)-L-asparaginase [bacterium]